MGPGAGRQRASGTLPSARVPPRGVSPGRGPAERSHARETVELCHLQLRRVRPGGRLRDAARGRNGGGWCRRAGRVRNCGCQPGPH
eukprot:15442098-Alexandrium_andersonii.AAC.1